MDIRRSLPRHKTLLAGAPLAVIAVFAAGCGGSSSGGATDAVTPSSSSTAQGRAAAVGVSDGHLVDQSGRTLYLFEADKSSASTCAGACATEWPPVTTDGSPTAAKGAKASLLGTSARDDGATQVTYAGHPLYLYAGDTAPGDTNGAGLDSFGAEWYPVTATGETLEDEESGGGGDDDSGSDESSDSGYSYSY